MVYLFPVISNTNNNDSIITEIGRQMIYNQMVDKCYITSDTDFIDDFMKTIAQKLSFPIDILR